MKTFLVIFLSLISLCAISQESYKQTRNIEQSLNSSYIDSLKSIYSFNKDIPEEYELPVYLTLSYFPELDSTKIILKKAKIKTTLNARPTLTSLIFNKKENRKYVIRINSSSKDSVVLLDSVPFNAVIGLLGHEFYHFIDFSEKNFFGVVSRLLDYSTKKSKESFEKEIDNMTITRGLGWQLYDWSYYVLNHSNGSVSYKEFKKEIYLEPEEIKERIFDIERAEITK